MKKSVKVYSAFDIPDHEGCDFFDENSPVIQYFRDESDINNIVHLWSQGRVDPTPTRIPARYVDCTQIEDFQHALDVLCDAEEILDTLSPAQRAKFHDDPVSFVEYFSDPSHEKEFLALTGSTSSLTKPAAPQPSSPESSDTSDKSVDHGSVVER